MKVLVGLIALTYLAVTGAQQDVVPSGAIGVVTADGGNIVINCERELVSSELSWTFRPHDGADDGSDDIDVYDTTDIPPESADPSRWIVEPNGGDPATALEFPLTIVAVSSTGADITAGTYTCDINAATPVDGSIEVVEIEEASCDPSITTTTPGTDVNFDCIVTKISHIDDTGIQPYFLWTGDENSDIGDIFGAGTANGDGDEFTDTFSREASNNPAINEDDQPLICHYHFNNVDPVGAPYAKTCSADVVTVQRTPSIIGQLAESVITLECTRTADNQELFFTFLQHDDTTGTPTTIWDAESGDEPLTGYSVDDTTDPLVPVLTIESFSADLAGEYSCVLDNEGFVPEFITTIVLIDQPDCTVNTPSVSLGDDVQYDCSVQKLSHLGDATPEPYFQWLDNDGNSERAAEVGTEDGDTNIFNAAPLDVTINNDVMNTQPYTCSVSFDDSGANSPVPCVVPSLLFLAGVFPSDPIVVLDGTENSDFGCTRGAVGDTLRLYFTPYNNAEGEILIYDTGDTSDPEPDGYTVTTVDDLTYTLTISSVSLGSGEDLVTAGTYRCELLVGGAGDDTGGSVEVVAVSAPVCDVTPGLGSETSFEQATFTCEVSANQPPDSVQWEFQWTQGTNDLTAAEPVDSVDGFIGSSISTLLVSVGDLAFDSQYVCDVTVSGSTFQGQCNDQVTLVVGLEAPQANSLEEGSPAADMVMLYCGLTDDAEATVEWFFTPFNAADPEPVDTADDRWSVNQSELEAHVDGFVSELHITPVTAESEPFTAGSYSCTITPGGAQTDTIPLDAVTISTYEMTCRVDEDPAIEFVCEMQSSSDEVVWTDPQWAPEGGDPVDGTLDENVEGAESDFTIDQYSYTPAETVDTAGTTYICSAQVGEQEVTCSTQHGGASHVQLSVGVMLAALLLSALRIF